ncbi:MAG: hypothetical protein KF812_05570 [Fimbriimonadaceae bacterium]|nr:hypothetical protein [Fimbriimonadaceae bacterium]
MKLKAGQALLYAAGLATILACGGSGSGIGSLDLGTGVVEDFGSFLRMRGRIAFENGNGDLTDGPTEGSIVMVGSGTRVVGADRNGGFLVDNIPENSQLRVRCFARGFLPIDFTIPEGETRTEELRLIRDLDMGNNPTIQNVQFDVDNNGILRFMAQIPNGTLPSAFISPTLNPNFLTGANGDTLNVQVQQQGNSTMMIGDIGETMPTGSLYMFVAGATGVSDKRYGTCQLNLTDYRRAGRLVNGNITGPGGVACEGAEVLAFEQGQTDNRGSSVAQAEGRFGSSLNETPTGQVSLLVQWTDPATNIVYVCLFKDNL